MTKVGTAIAPAVKVVARVSVRPPRRAATVPMMVPPRRTRTEA